MTRLRRRLALDRPAGEEGAALLLVIMLVLVVGMLGALVTSAVIRQVRPTQLASKTTTTVYAAETGLQVALSQLRTAKGAVASDGKVYGDIALLPCTVTGDADASSGARFSVTIDYLDADGSPLSCSSAGVSAVPASATLTSVGTAAAVPGQTAAQGTRRLTATYTFSATNANVPGGTIWSFGHTACLQAVSATAGSEIIYAAATTCLTGAPLQTWQYGTDYRILLTSTATSDQPLCLTGSSQRVVTVRLAACSPSRNDQLFAFGGQAYFNIQNADNTATSAYCLATRDRTERVVGQKLYSNPLCTEVNKEYASWDPAPGVGAGNASYAVQEVVNYRDFGRCLDLRGGLTLDVDRMIAYPCKQDPATNTPYWNHRYTYQEPAGLVGTTAAQTVTVTQRVTSRPDYNGQTWCMTTPAARPTTGMPRFSPCDGRATQQWTRTANVEGDYASSWVFKDVFGRCLSVSDDPAYFLAFQAGGWKSIVVTTCTGTAEQKWNAPADLSQALVNDIREGVGG